MYFDGASRSPDGTKQETTKNNKSGIGIVFVTLEGALLPYSFALSEGCSNNEAEYEFVIAGLELALQIPIIELTIYGDSQLVVKQLRGEYTVRRTNLVPYHERANQLLSQFRKVQIFHIRRGVNARADSLVGLATSMTLPDNKTITITVGERRVLQPLNQVPQLEPVFIINMIENVKDWREPFINYLLYGRLPEEKAKRAEIRRRAVKFIMWKETLYKRSLDGVYLRCIAKGEIQEVMKEVHAGCVYQQRMANAFNKKIDQPRHLGITQKCQWDPPLFPSTYRDQVLDHPLDESQPPDCIQRSASPSMTREANPAFWVSIIGWKEKYIALLDPALGISAIKFKKHHWRNLEAGIATAPCSASFLIAGYLQMTSPLDPSTPFSGLTALVLAIKRYKGYNSKINNYDSRLDETSSKMMHGSKHFENSLHQQFKQKPSSNQRNHFLESNSSMEMHEDAGETSVYDLMDNNEIKAKHGYARTMMDSVSSHHLRRYGGEVTNKQTEPRVRNSDDMNPKVAQRERVQSTPMMLKHGEFLDSKEKGQPRRMSKAAKRVRDEYRQQQHLRKAATTKLPPLTNKTRRAAEVPSSFSEDETALFMHGSNTLKAVGKINSCDWYETRQEKKATGAKTQTRSCIRCHLPAGSGMP
ncbi:hypothetical protein RJ639_018394 [Escallonia herrerae]|uniref:RNase H type-1 domain-containing protein n=1 Tax=Escallonia herrerae TaxID=1293975 RepID=A0AA88VAE4_9ASTE|nr:hypothetical protein RJ639_018394 [Escallonia herrerae]